MICSLLPYYEQAMNKEKLYGGSWYVFFSGEEIKDFPDAIESGFSFKYKVLQFKEKFFVFAIMRYYVSVIIRKGALMCYPVFTKINKSLVIEFKDYRKLFVFSKKVFIENNYKVHKAYVTELLLKERLLNKVQMILQWLKVIKF